MALFDLYCVVEYTQSHTATDFHHYVTIKMTKFGVKS